MGKVYSVPASGFQLVKSGLYNYWGRPEPASLDYPDGPGVIEPIVRAVHVTPLFAAPPDNGNVEVLRVVKSDLKIGPNGSSHRTDKYALMTQPNNPNLVVRRGQDFALEISFNRPFLQEKDGISLIFSVGDGKPSLSHGTMVIVPLEGTPRNSGSPNEWHAYVVDVSGSKATIQVKTSSKCPVGKWKVAIDSKLKSSQSTAVSYKLPTPIYVLFNPWNSADEVFLESEDARQEYILEDSGLIWAGSHTRLRPLPWVYSQFEADILECSFKLLSKGLKPSIRGDAIKTIRILSALVNSNDDEGVLTGNWSGDYTGGVSPTEWSGSAKILRQYSMTQKPVQFGQCWVFAGVLTTICRAIGIPCRPVTNFSSAHDTQSSLTIDHFIDENGKKVEDLDSDSIWNFHVWCEVWMKREDLGNEIYGGWQAVDATPQELSDGIFRLGPASVEACRRGEVKQGYDVDFLFSEVNADEVTWKYSGPSQPLKLLGRNVESVGRHISTKAIGTFAREDITLNYKYPEKSSKEREAMFAALKQNESSYSRYYLNEEFNDLRFDFKLLDDITIGSAFRVQLQIKNVSPTKQFDVKGFIRVDSQLYTGKRKDLVVKKDIQRKILPRTVDEVTFEVTYEQYSKALTPEGAFNAACLVSVVQTNFEYFAQDDFRVRKPDIKITFPRGTDPQVGKQIEVTTLLQNPLPVPLTKCCFFVEAPSLTEPIKIQLTKSIQPGEVAAGKFHLVPKLAGQKTITAKLSSPELQDVDGFLVLNVHGN
ncbi:unnamed protein product [Allacma fusca]|uniref:protein-glutamine gamma-glutamyltransferase n=1 Tax=Allacma fusca TaxID=39272 RepID=A0A8J2J3P5_9HEXA|nr:unnamed protein product [Allacma fusca]